MACYATGTPQGDAALATEFAQRQVTELTRMLCMTIELIKQQRGVEWEYSVPEPVLCWYRAHVKIDDERRKREEEEQRQWEVAYRAYHKLTEEERAALKVFKPGARR